MVDVVVSVDDLKTLVLYKGDAIELQSYVDNAKVIIDTILATSSLGADLLNVIALNMAGHLFVVSAERGGFSFRKSGESEARMRIPASDKLSFLGTRFGQMACSLDSSGLLLQHSRIGHSQMLIETVEIPTE